MANILKAVGRSVRSLRKARNWSQEQLAEHADLHVNYVGGIERGERNVSLENLAKIARGLKVPLTEVFALAESRGAEHTEDVAALLSVTDPAIAEALRDFLRKLNDRCAALQASSQKH